MIQLFAIFCYLCFCCCFYTLEKLRVSEIFCFTFPNTTNVFFLTPQAMSVGKKIQKLRTDSGLLSRDEEKPCRAPPAAPWSCRDFEVNLVLGSSLEKVGNTLWGEKSRNLYQIHICTYIYIYMGEKSLKLYHIHICTYIYMYVRIPT